jgi:hypothetical protein
MFLHKYGRCWGSEVLGWRTGESQNKSLINLPEAGPSVGTLGFAGNLRNQAD